MGWLSHRLLGWMAVAFLAALPVRAQMTVHQGEDASSFETAEAPQTRFFREVHEARFPGTYHALARLAYNGDYVLLVETDAARRPISDTLLVWVQHHGPGQPLARQARWADLIITCYPDLLVDAVRRRHVLPDAQGKVWLYFVDERHVIVSDQRHPVLDFALKKKF